MSEKNHDTGQGRKKRNSSHTGKRKEKAEIREGDYVEVTARETGLILIKKLPTLEETQTKMAGKLPQWSKLEGEANELIEKEL